MSNEIEARLEQLLAQLPEPDADLSERALARALQALPQPLRRAAGPLRTLVIALAASLVLLGIAAGALAAVGALHVSFGQVSHRRVSTNATASVARLAVPAGAHGIAAIVDGQLWLTTRSGLRIQGLPVSTATLSPRALYVAAGIGDSLVAMAPDGRRAWSQPTAGTVAAIAWAPDGLQIAYVVHSTHGFRLHVIDGNGQSDQLIDTAVRPVTPSWRADSLALAYVSAGGHPVIYDLGHRSRKLIASPKAHDATQLTFAPRGKALAVATRSGFLLTNGAGRANGFDFSPAFVVGVGWLDDRLAVAVNSAYPGKEQPLVRLFQVGPGADPAGSLVPPGQIKALDANGGRITAAVLTHGGIQVLTATPKAPTGKVPLMSAQTLLQLAPRTRIDALVVR